MQQSRPANHNSGTWKKVRDIGQTWNKLFTYFNMQMANTASVMFFLFCYLFQNWSRRLRPLLFKTQRHIEKKEDLNFSSMNISQTNTGLPNPFHTLHSTTGNYRHLAPHTTPYPWVFKWGCQQRKEPNCPRFLVKISESQTSWRCSSLFCIALTEMKILTMNTSIFSNCYNKRVLIKLYNRPPSHYVDLKKECSSYQLDSKLINKLNELRSLI